MPLRVITLMLLCLTVPVLQNTQAQTTVSFETNLGNIEVQLFDETATATVDNFLGYVSRGDYENTIFHRSVLAPSNLSIIQGGGFTTTGAAIATQPAIDNEFGASNLRGTIAMARNSNVNSATSQFFFNTDDNSENLDNQNEGFTVFGQVTAGLDVMDAIQMLDTIDPNGPANQSNFDNLPVLDSNQGTIASNLVVLQRVTIISAVPEPSAAIVLAIGGLMGCTRRRRQA